MTTFLLVHGAWHGGWCYRETARELRAAGHDVFTPTLTGLGERAHLASDAITLETHIEDVCAVIRAEELSDVVLVGHSYGGILISAAADRMADRVKALVYVDAYVPDDGTCLNDMLKVAVGPELGAEYVASYRASASDSSTRGITPREAVHFNVDPRNREWVDRQCVPQPLATFEDRVTLTGAVDSITDRLFILADDWEPNLFRHYADKVSGLPGWRVVVMPSGHDIMVDMPVELAHELAKMG